MIIIQLIEKQDSVGSGTYEDNCKEVQNHSEKWTLRELLDNRLFKIPIA